MKRQDLWTKRYSTDRLAYVPEFTVLHHCQRMSRSRILSPIGLKHIEGLVHLYFKYKRLF